MDVCAEAQRKANHAAALVVQTSVLLVGPRKRSIGNDNKGSDSPPKKNWKKPKDMPRRPLSAYNLFFKSERLAMLSLMTNKKESGPWEDKSEKALGIGFAGMARSVASKWQIIPSSDKSVFEVQARIEKARYYKEIDVWRRKQQAAKKDPIKMTRPLEEEASLMATTFASSTTPSTMALDDTTPVDPSDKSGHFLPTRIQGMKRGTLLTRENQELCQLNSVADMGRFQLLPILQLDTLSNGSQPMWSIVRSFDFASDYPRQQKVRWPSLIESVPKESGVVSSTYAPVQDSYWPWCWESLVSALSSDPFVIPSNSGGERVQEGAVFDDLSLFKSIMGGVDC